MSAHLEAVAERSAAPFDWNAVGLFGLTDPEAETRYLRSQRLRDVREIQVLRRALRDAEAPDPGAAAGAWILAAIVFTAGVAAGLCFYPPLNRLLLEHL